MERAMQVAKWGNSLAVRIPSAVAKALNLKEGDEVQLVATDGQQLQLITREDRLAALERLREFRGRLPAGWKFDRDEANAR
jgi:antitoxin MazE